MKNVSFSKLQYGSCTKVQRNTHHTEQKDQIFYQTTHQNLLASGEDRTHDLQIA